MILIYMTEKREKKFSNRLLAAKGVCRETRNLRHIKFLKLFRYEKSSRKYLMKLANRTNIYGNTIL